MEAKKTARLMAGIPKISPTLYHKIRFVVGDPVAWVDVPGAGSTLILRDIEMDRASKKACVDKVACPADFAPDEGLSGDRETATAQAAAECLKRAGVASVAADRSLPLIYAEMLKRAGIALECDLGMGVMDRRAKDENEIAAIRKAQETTETVMQRACEMIAHATARADGVLMHEGEPLTSERVRAAIDHWLIDLNYTNPSSIIACGSQGADCHEYGSGELRTGEPVIVDIFPCDGTTLYNGDCTRSVVHGDIPDELIAMNKAVRAAKAAAIAAIRPGVTGEDVHKATIASLEASGFRHGFPPKEEEGQYATMPHGTGHGVGLEVHEPPLLDFKGPELVVGDAVTVEPGLYRKGFGGTRVEDIVVVTEDGCINLNCLQEGLKW